MAELERLVAATGQAIRERFEGHDVRPGKMSLWIKLIKLVEADGAKMEETVGSVHKAILTVNSFDELVHHLAENMVLAVYGSEIQVVKEMPNLIVKLVDKKAHVPTVGAPPIDQAGQVYLKATVYRWEPSLWEQIFKRKGREE